MKTCQRAGTLLLVIALAAGCSNSTDKKEPLSNAEDVVPVRLEPVTREFVSNAIRTAGLVRASNEVKLSFEQPGEIAEILTSEGAIVSKGQELARLDRTIHQARLEKAKISFEKAERDLNRLEKLLLDSVVTQQQVLDANSLLSNARADLEIAKHSLEKSTVTAPFSGQITLKLVEEKELVAAGTPAFVLTDLSSVKIELSVADDQIHRIGTNDPVSVFSDAYPSRNFEGSVSLKSVRADPVTGTFKVEARVPNSQRHLLSGMVVRVVISSAVRTEALLIPIEGHVAGDAGAHFLFVYDPETSTVTRRQVEIGNVVGNKLEITQGIAEGDLIVVSGSEYIRDGAKVTANPK